MKKLILFFKRPDLYFYLFIILFIAENVAVISLTYTYRFSFDFLFFRFAFKFCLFYSLIGLITALLPRFISYLVITINAMLNIGIYSWHHFLGGIPSITAIRASAEAGAVQQLSLFSYVHREAALVFALVFIVELLLLSRCSKVWTRPKRRLALVCGVLLLSLGGSLYSWSRSVNPFRLNGDSIPGNVRFFGYNFTWMAEIFFVKLHTTEATCASEKAQWPPLFPASDKVVYIQVECLDFSLMGLTAGNGAMIMPFLTEIAEKGLLVLVDGRKKLNSANSDYEFLNTRVATPIFNYYSRMKEYPDSLALAFRNRGLNTAFFHNYHSTFLNRMEAVPNMGFESVIFMEDLLKADYPVKEALMPHVDDRDLFSFAARHIPDSPFFHVLITMAMHDKDGYDLNPLFVGEKHQGFFTNARITDDALRNYVASLPPETTVIIMGDHTSYHEPRSGYVPLILFRTGSGFKIPFSESIVLTRCEASQYVRRVFDLPAPTCPVMLKEGHDFVF